MTEKLDYKKTFLIGFGIGSTLPVIPLFAKSLGASLGLTGFIVAVKGIGNMTMNVPGGIFASKFSQKKLMLISAVGIAAVSFAIGLCRGLVLFSSLMFVMGLANGLWLVTRLNYLKAVFSTRQRGRAAPASTATCR